MSYEKKMGRRAFLKFSKVSFLVPYLPFGQILFSEKALAAPPKKYFVQVHSIFDFRDKGKFNFNNYLSPLNSYRSGLRYFSDLIFTKDNIGGDEYHHTKETFYATGNRNHDRHRNYGRGPNGGKSLDVVVGEYLKGIYKSKDRYLNIGIGKDPTDNAFNSCTWTSSSKVIYPYFNLGSVKNLIEDKANQDPLCNAATIDVASLQNEIYQIGKSNEVLKASEKELTQLQAEFSGTMKDRIYELREKMDQRIQKNNSDIKQLNNTINGAPPEPSTPCLQDENKVSSPGFSGREAYLRDRVRDMNFYAAVALKYGVTNSVTLNYNIAGHGSQQNVKGIYHPTTHPRSGDFNSRFDSLTMFQTTMFKHLLDQLNAVGILNQCFVYYSCHEGFRAIGHGSSSGPWELGAMVYNGPRTGHYGSRREVSALHTDIVKHLKLPGYSYFGDPGRVDRNGGIL